MKDTEPVHLGTLHHDEVWRVLLNTPKANILDEVKIERLTALFDRARREHRLKAIVIEGQGPNFSFGASVEEHLPGRYESMIPAFHRLFLAMLDAAVPTLAVVRGRCLGGGLELASFCNRVFAAPDASLGQPEIVLGVFAPVASVTLAERIGRSRAEDLCLSGRSISAIEAERIGLVDQIDEAPGVAAMEYAKHYLLPRSASSLRLALRALRCGYADRFRGELARVERLYMDTLMSTDDAREGLQAFVENRKPEWTHK